MIRAILFDKDGTLTDFRATWEAWMPGMLADLSRETGVAIDPLADAIGFDTSAGRIRPDGLFVTAPNEVTVAALTGPSGWSHARLTGWMEERTRGVRQVPVTDVGAFLGDLRDQGYALGVLTNGSEAEAVAHLGALGGLPFLDRVIGYDSGWGPKPGPGGALEFARSIGIAPADIVLVGDGLTDMEAARAAGMRAVAVLSGTLPRDRLGPLAERVLDDIRDLPAWLAGKRSG